MYFYEKFKKEKQIDENIQEQFLQTENYIDKIHRVNRMVFLNKQIDFESITEINAKILELRNINEFDPIALYVNSPGGDVRSALWLANEIIYSDTPIITICPGTCSSAAVLPFIAGHLRIVFEHSEIMIHGMTTYLFGNIKNINSQYSSSSSLVTTLINFMTKNTKIKKDVITKSILHDAELYYTGEAIIKSGLGDNFYNGIAVIPEKIQNRRTLFVVDEKPPKNKVAKKTIKAPKKKKVNVKK